VVLLRKRRFVRAPARSPAADAHVVRSQLDLLGASILIKREWDHLFSEYDLDAILRNQLEQVRERVVKLDQNHFKTTSDDFISATLASELVVSPVVLLEDQIAVSTHDAKIDVSHDFSRASWGDGPTLVDGLEVTYHLPYVGEKELLKCRPSTFTLNPPRGVIASGELQFPYDQPDRDLAATKRFFLEDVARIKEWLSWVNAQVTEYNQRLEAAVRQHVVDRRQELDRTQSDLQSLGYAIRSNTPSPSNTPSGNPADVQVRRKARREKARRTYDIALSFAGEDREFVEQVANALRQDGITVFYDRFEEVNLWGSDLAEHLGKVYGTDSRYVILFLSRHYAAKAWSNHEKQFALSRHLRGDTGRILPVRFDDTEIPGLAPTIGYLDARVLTPSKLAELIRQKLDSGERDA
jgi:heme oxygenase